jgi:hypothetical protein
VAPEVVTRGLLTGAKKHTPVVPGSVAAPPVLIVMQSENIRLRKIALIVPYRDLQTRIFCPRLYSTCLVHSARDLPATVQRLPCAARGYI